MSSNYNRRPLRGEDSINSIEDMDNNNSLAAKEVQAASARDNLRLAVLKSAQSRDREASDNIFFCNLEKNIYSKSFFSLFHSWKKIIGIDIYIKMAQEDFYQQLWQNYVGASANQKGAVGSTNENCRIS